MNRKLLYITFGTIPALLWGILIAGLLVYSGGTMWSGYPLLAVVWGYCVAPIHNRTTRGRKRLIYSVLLLIGLVFSAFISIDSFILDHRISHSLNRGLVLAFFTTGPGFIALHYLAESVFIWRGARSSTMVTDT